MAMLYRPKFCANCGEKIERANWGWLTSRRFCPVCESEFKGQDLIPRFVVGAGIALGIFGIGGYLRSSPSGEPSSLRQPKRLVEQTTAAAPIETPERQRLENANAVSKQPEPQPATQTPQTLMSLRQPAASLKTEVAEAQYYCGAETKKGTPCSRRVKGNVRCYQHIGMPAMLSSDKLKIK